MKSKAALHLVLAILLATVAGGLTLRWLSGQKPALRQADMAPVEVAPPVKTQNLVVAAKGLERGLRLSPDMLKTVPYDPDLVPPQSFANPDELAGRTLSRRLSPGDPITEDKLFPKGAATAGLEQLVEPGRRAVTVRGSKELGAGGLIVPGSRVDVIMTMQREESPDPDAPEIKESKLILTDIPVLATGTEMEPKIGKDGREELSATDYFTLQVTPAEAEKLTFAANNHVLSFALRSPADRDAVATSGADLTAVLERRDAPGADPALVEDPPVEVIRGLSKRHRQPKEDTVERKVAPGSREAAGTLPVVLFPTPDGGDGKPAQDSDIGPQPVIP
ncbi:Flp pilus assembly protein CpaB [Desulfovibrio sulfodismutans]|uniref:Flp pilus assembly protein CpaB n=1 Tax=Desulfolutivibrio sulfodismutans TaxID=63561 RepID=A0A7K3NLR1_9BACT|nr:Flp pilus assembly protein CpaB [Desulfolutivibrio sulfodismutans]NDY56715.1 Flp pilus assembly protein CpaB [Desulfolutivibrio sulfodismutans]